jgi:hypothetical protein
MRYPGSISSSTSLSVGKGLLIKMNAKTKKMSFLFNFIFIQTQEKLMEEHFKSVNNGRISTVNRALDGSPYPG